MKFPSLLWEELMEQEFCKQQAPRTRDLAEKADPFTWKRPLAFADRNDTNAGRPSKAAFAKS